MERRPSRLGVPDVLDLAAVEPLPGVPQHDALLLFAGGLNVHPYNGLDTSRYSVRKEGKAVGRISHDLEGVELRRRRWWCARLE